MSDKLLTHQEAVRLGVAVARDRGLGVILENHAPNLAVCPTCRVDDWCHTEGCKIAERIEVAVKWLDGGDTRNMPWELGALVYMPKRGPS